LISSVGIEVHGGGRTDDVRDRAPPDPQALCGFGCALVFETLAARRADADLSHL